MSENLTPEVLADLKARAEKATPGEWQYECGDHTHRYVLVRDEDDRTIFYKYGAGPKAESDLDERNAAYIHAAQPYVVLSLLTALEEAKSGLHGVMEAGRQEIALLRARAEKAEQQAAERLEALKISQAYALPTLNGLIDSDIEAEITATAQRDKALIAAALSPSKSEADQ